MLSRRLLSRHLLIVVSLLVVSCQPRPSAGPADQEPLPRPHPADTIEVARHLPRTLRALFITPNLEVLVEQLGRSALIEVLRADYEEAAYQSVRETGHNLLSPAGLRAVGIDVAGPAGVAVIDGISSPTVIGFASVAEPDKLKTALYRLSTGAFTRSELGGRPEVVGDAVIVGEDDIAVMLVQSLVMVVVSDDDSRQIAKRLAALPAGETASDHEPFRAALGALPQAADVRGFLDPRGLTYGLLGLDPRWGGNSFAAEAAQVERGHRAALVRARARGASVPEMVAIDDDHQFAREQLIDDPDIPWLRPLLGSVDGLGLEIALRADGLDLTVLANLDRAGKVAQLFQSERVSPALVSSVSEQPGLWLQLAIRPAMVLQIAELFGTRPAALSKTLGVDVERELLPVLSGELAVAVSPRERDLDALAKGEIDLVVLLGIGDSKAATRLVAQLGKAEALASLMGRGAQGEVVVTLPGLRPLHIRARDKYLVLSTDPSWELSPPAKRPAPWLGASRATRLAAKPGGSVLGTVDLGLLWRAILARGATPRLMSMKPYREPDVPLSPETQQKNDELAEIDAQIADRARTLSRRAVRPQLQLARSVGSLGFRLAETDHGLQLQLRYATAGRPLASLLTALVREQLGSATRFPVEEDELSELQDRRDGVFIDLETIHQQERKDHQDGGPGKPAESD